MVPHGAVEERRPRRSLRLQSDGECTLPEPGDGVSYTQVAAGGYHTVLLRSDGRAVACGYNGDGQCTLPEPGDGVSYTQVAAGGGTRCC